MDAALNDYLIARLAETDAASQVVDLLLDEVGRAKVGPNSDPHLALDQVFLSCIELEGFRGIGAERKLKFESEPGLTVVVGANGCGKSSFAEAAELALTGSVARISRGSKDTQAVWRNLHHGSCRVRLTYRSASGAHSWRSTLTWDDGDPIGGARRDSRPTSANSSVLKTEADWPDAVRLFPPPAPA